MAATPKYKVYGPGRADYRAACVYREDAAALVAFLGTGSTVRIAHAKRWTVWTQGEDGDAAESYDVAVGVMTRREKELQREAYMRIYGSLPKEGR